MVIVIPKGISQATRHPKYEQPFCCEVRLDEGSDILLSENAYLNWQTDKQLALAWFSSRFSCARRWFLLSVARLRSYYGWTKSCTT